MRVDFVEIGDILDVPASAQSRKYETRQDDHPAAWGKSEPRIVDGYGWNQHLP